MNYACRYFCMVPTKKKFLHISRKLPFPFLLEAVPKHVRIQSSWKFSLKGIVFMKNSQIAFVNATNDNAELNKSYLYHAFMYMVYRLWMFRIYSIGIQWFTLNYSVIMFNSNVLNSTVWLNFTGRIQASVFDCKWARMDPEKQVQCQHVLNHIH